ncbi:MAG: hypothetical protein QQN46_09385, partial [Nitrosopumilus sp.]
SEGKVLLVGDESKVQLFASFENEDTGEEFVLEIYFFTKMKREKRKEKEISRHFFPPTFPGNYFFFFLFTPKETAGEIKDCFFEK